MIHGKSIRARRRAFVALVIASFVFALVQGLAAAHVGKYGSAPHTHHGQVCVLSLAAPGGDKIIETASVLLIVSIAIWRVVHHGAQTELARLTIRAAQPRGPPKP